MRLLPERLGADGEGAARHDAEADRQRRPQGMREPDLPLRQPQADFLGGPTGREDDGGESMSPRASKITRRAFVRDASGLVIGFSMLDSSLAPRLLAQSAVLGAPKSPRKLESWLHVLPDGGVRVFTGKLEIGMGVDTALAQIVAEELDLAPGRVTFVLGDTSQTTDQGGVGGSTSVSLGSKPLRNVAATARATLVQLASQRLGVSAAQLEVHDGVVSVKGDASKRVTYAQLASANLDAAAG